MIAVLVKKIVNFIALKSNIEDIYYLDRIRYGLEILIGEGVKFIIILLISLMLSRLPEFCIITMLIFGVRTKLGGGHCNSFARCFIKTISIYLIMYFLSSFLSSIVVIPGLIRVLILVSVVATIFTGKYRTKIKKIEDPKTVLKLKFRTSFIYLFTYILVRVINNSTYINLVLFFGLYMVYEYYMNNRRKEI